MYIVGPRIDTKKAELPLHFKVDTVPSIPFFLLVPQLHFKEGKVNIKTI